MAPSRKEVIARPSSMTSAVYKPLDFAAFRPVRSFRACLSVAPILDPRRELGLERRLRPQHGRVAQRESTPFTREGSQVQSLPRPPGFARKIIDLDTVPFCSSRHRNAYKGRTRHINPWRIRGLCSRDVQSLACTRNASPSLIQLELEFRVPFEPFRPGRKAFALG